MCQALALLEPRVDEPAAHCPVERAAGLSSQMWPASPSLLPASLQCVGAGSCGSVAEPSPSLQGSGNALLCDGGGWSCLLGARHCCPTARVWSLGFGGVQDDQLTKVHQLQSASFMSLSALLHGGGSAHLTFQISTFCSRAACARKPPSTEASGV